MTDTATGGASGLGAPSPPPAPRARQASEWTLPHTVGLLALTGLSVWMAVSRPSGLYTSWLVVMAAMLAFILIAGHGIKGVWRGAFIDDRNRISLSRFQMLAWTIVLLSGLATIVIARVASNAMTAMEVTIDPNLWILMGISATSLVGSPMIQSNKAARGSDQGSAQDQVTAQGGSLEEVAVQGQMVKFKTIDKASWSDLFTGEDVSNFSFLDLGKIQMFFFTVLLVLSYGVSLGSLLLSGTVPDALPSVSEGMLALLGISHGGYLVNKTIPSRAS